MRIERAEVHRVAWPLAGGGRGGAARGRWRARDGVVLVLHGEGLRGLGEASPLPGLGAEPGAAARAAQQLARFARALPLTIDAARPLTAAAALAATTAEPAARFAIETAVLDLLAQRAGVSLAALLNPRVLERTECSHPTVRPERRASAASPESKGPPGPPTAPVAALRAALRTNGMNGVASARVVDDADGAVAAWAAGFATLKLKTDDLDRVTAVRRAVPHARLRLDVNQGWPDAEVDRRLRALVPMGLEYVEEPAAELAPRLRAPRACALALDESLARADRDEWLERALASGAIVALVLKPTVLGGLAACLALAARAGTHGVDAVASHALEGPIATAAIAELARALGGPRAHGVDVHAGLHTWSRIPPQLAPGRIIAARATGLGFDAREGWR